MPIAPAYQSLSDAELVEHCRHQLPYRTDAFEALVRRYEPRVYQTCLRYLGFSPDAEEVTQNVFLRVFHSLPSFERRAAFRTWLYRIVANECATRYRKIKRRAEQRAAYAQVVRAESPHTDNADPTGRPVELSGPIGAAWGTLSEADRRILALRHVADLPLKHLAEALEVGLSAAKMRLYRAEERLRAAYEQARKASV